jgi:hypothetical protein
MVFVLREGLARTVHHVLSLRTEAGNTLDPAMPLYQGWETVGLAAYRIVILLPPHHPAFHTAFIDGGCCTICWACIS